MLLSRPDLAALIERIDAALPQTQCTRCGYPDCRAYAQAIAQGQAGINQCPPGGAEGIARLAALTGHPVTALDITCGSEGPRHVAVIDEAWCIGCTLCAKACPVDCIVGANKHMHTVIEPQCTGCELCVPACPVDCIALVPITHTTGWAAWSPEHAQTARARYAAHRARAEHARREHDERLRLKAGPQPPATTATTNAPAAAAAPPDDRKRAAIEAALARARAQRAPR